MSELPYTFPIRWYGDALDAYAVFASHTGAFSIALNDRYTLMGWEPRQTFSSDGGFVTTNGHTRIGNPQEELQKFIAPLQALPHDPYHPFYSGLVGYMQDDKSWFGVYDPVVVFDRIEEKLTILSMGLDDDMIPRTYLAEERAIHLAQQMVHHNGTSKALADTAQTPSPLQFMPLDAIHARCAGMVA